MIQYIELFKVPGDEDDETSDVAAKMTAIQMSNMATADNVSAEDVTNLLSRFSSPEASITSYGPTNMLVLTDTGANVRRMLRLIAAIEADAVGRRHQPQHEPALLLADAQRLAVAQLSNPLSAEHDLDPLSDVGEEIDARVEG